MQRKYRLIRERAYAEGAEQFGIAPPPRGVAHLVRSVRTRVALLDPRNLPSPMLAPELQGVREEPHDVDFELTNEQRMLQESARRLAG
jgi:hypothetical protein